VDTWGGGGWEILKSGLACQDSSLPYMCVLSIGDPYGTAIY